MCCRFPIAGNDGIWSSHHSQRSERHSSESWKVVPNSTVSLLTHHSLSLLTLWLICPFLSNCDEEITRCYCGTDTATSKATFLISVLDRGLSFSPSFVFLLFEQTSPQIRQNPWITILLWDWELLVFHIPTVTDWISYLDQTKPQKGITKAYLDVKINFPSFSVQESEQTKPEHFQQG